MRKVSKSRGEDDVVSSTNGSVINDDHAREASVEKEKAADSIAYDSEDRDDDASSTTKNSKAPKRGRPQKSKKKKEGAKKPAEEEYEVDTIIDSKKIKGKLHYLIRWKGYSSDNDTWEPENTVSCPDLINKFKDQKQDSKEKEKTSVKKAKKRKSKPEHKSTSKRTKTVWDSENADENAEYEVERILEVHHKKNGKKEFLIHWKGWSNKFDSWEPEDNLNCPDLINKFLDKVNSAKSIDSRNLRVAPGTTNRFTLQPPDSGRRLSKRRGQRQRVRYDDAE